MLVGLALILAGFLLMLGPDANTVDGKLDPNAWNEDIFHQKNQNSTVIGNFWICSSGFRDS